MGKGLKYNIIRKKIFLNNISIFIIRIFFNRINYDGYGFLNFRGYAQEDVASTSRSLL